MIKTLKGSKETLTNYNQARKNNAQSRKNIDTLAVKKAQANYKKATGREMTPSKLKAELNGGMMSRDTKKYLSDKKSITKTYRKRFGL